MNIARWDPWGEMVSLRDAMERLVSDSFVRGRSGDVAGAGASTLAVDVHEQGDDFVLTAPTPGVQPEDVEITVRGDLVRIRGERRDEREESGDDRRWLMREQRFGSFERVLRLPSPVSADSAQAEFKDGILTVTLPKTEESKERRIPIQAGGQTRQPRPASIESSSSGDAKQKAA